MTAYQAALPFVTFAAMTVAVVAFVWLLSVRATVRRDETVRRIRMGLHSRMTELRDARSSSVPVQADPAAAVRNRMPG